MKNMYLDQEPEKRKHEQSVQKQQQEFKWSAGVYEGSQNQKSRDFRGQRTRIEEQENFTASYSGNTRIKFLSNYSYPVTINS